MKHSVALHAFAKINLGLRILGKRPDDYHEIRTLYQTVDLHDNLEVKLLPGEDGVDVECLDPAVPSGRGNLVYQACQLWKRARRFTGRIEVRLKKQIPPGSGLGGASSDAAATLVGLEHLGGDRLDLATRLQFAARLGSDVTLGRYKFKQAFIEINGAFPLVNIGSTPLQHFVITFDQLNDLVRLYSSEETLHLDASPVPVQMINEPLQKSDSRLVPVG